MASSCHLKVCLSTSHHQRERCTSLHYDTHAHSCPPDRTRSQFWFINISCSHHHDKHTTLLSHVVFITEKAFLLTLVLIIVFVCLLGFLCSYLPQSHKPQTHPPLYKPPLNSFDSFSIDQVNNFFFFFKEIFLRAPNPLFSDLAPHANIFCHTGYSFCFSFVLIYVLDPMTFSFLKCFLPYFGGTHPCVAC